MIRHILPLVAALAMATSAPAQQTPKGETGADCDALSQTTFFCGTPPEFARVPLAEVGGLSAVFNTGDGTQAVAIVETFTPDQPRDAASLQIAALNVLANTYGVARDSIEILARQNIPVGGYPAASMVYRGTVEGQSFVYANTMLVVGDTLTQFITIERGTMILTPRHEALHIRYLSQVQVMS